MTALTIQTVLIITLSILAGFLMGVMFTKTRRSRNVNKQWLTYYIRRMLPEHKCKYCGCMTRQPDSECYARPQKPE